METSFIAFISLGFESSGREIGDYGKIIVNLTDEEKKAIAEIVKVSTKGYKRDALKENYPAIDKKIVDAANNLVRDVIINNAELFEPLSDEVQKTLSAMTYHEQADFLATHIEGLEPDAEQLKLAKVCYYLCDDEIPRDFATRYQE